IQYHPDASGCDPADRYLEKTMPFFSRAGLSFVPVVESGDGAWGVEGNNIAQVKAHMGFDCGVNSDNSSNGCAPVPEK
ncbi:MAG: hypothetical protein DRH26_16595, partial [Deltaproteobacteria bacterium]